jgi:CheY-like chemotaxis protein
MEHGYRVLVANDGGKGVALAEKFATELALVMVDIALPVLGGYEVIMNLVKQRLPVKIVAMTAAGNEYYLEVARQMGAHAALRKPPTGDGAAQAEWNESLRPILSGVDRGPGA